MSNANEIIATLRVNCKLEVTGQIKTECSQGHEYTLPVLYNAVVDALGQVDITDSVSSQKDFCGVCEEPNPEIVCFQIAEQHAAAFRALTNND